MLKNNCEPVLFALLMIASLLANGCEQSPSSQPPSTTRATHDSARSPWKSVNGDQIIGIDDETAQAQLNEAIARARSTADSARTRWSDATPPDRVRWLVKWAAPTAAGETEYVWVLPINWSPFRIEGELMSSPINELESGKAQGEVVSFPIDELADWLCFSKSNSARTLSGEFEGGFTVKAIDAAYKNVR